VLTRRKEGDKWKKGKVGSNLAKSISMLSKIIYSQKVTRNSHLRSVGFRRILPEKIHGLIVGHTEV
jgi:hypothetical protein